MLTELTQNTAENRSSLLFTLSTEEGESESVPYLSFFDTNYYISNRLFEDKFRKNVLIQMSEAGTMNFSVSGATGVEWEMYTGEVYTQNSEVPSGDINKPQIQFSEAGWVKLYVDDFNVNVDLVNISSNTEIASTVCDFSLIKGRFYASDSPNIFGDVSCINADEWVLGKLENSPKLFGNISDLLNITGIFSIRYAELSGDISGLKNAITQVRLSSCRGFEINDSTSAISANIMNLDDCDLSELYIYNLIKYNYDLNKQGGILDLTGVNAIPDAATVLLTNEMETNRGWDIATN